LLFREEKTIRKNNRSWDFFEIKYYWRLETFFPFYFYQRWRVLWCFCNAGWAGLPRGV